MSPPCSASTCRGLSSNSLVPVDILVCRLVGLVLASQGLVQVNSLGLTGVCVPVCRVIPQLVSFGRPMLLGPRLHPERNQVCSRPSGPGSWDIKAVGNCNLDGRSVFGTTLHNLRLAHFHCGEIGLVLCHCCMPTDGTCGCCLRLQLESNWV